MVPVIGNDCFFLSLKLQDQLLLFAELILCHTEKKQMEDPDKRKFYLVIWIRFITIITYIK